MSLPLLMASGLEEVLERAYTAFQFKYYSNILSFHNYSDISGFLCKPLVTRDEVQQSETEQLIDKMFGGSSELFFSAFLKNQGISEEAKRLAKLIEEAK